MPGRCPGEGLFPPSLPYESAGAEVEVSGVMPRESRRLCGCEAGGAPGEGLGGAWGRLCVCVCWSCREGRSRGKAR